MATDLAWGAPFTEEDLATVLHLEDGRYVEVTTVTGDEAYMATSPFPVTVAPARLLDP